jgi:subtilisin family serine protease
VKDHIVIKLRKQLPDDYWIPDWQDFILDKSLIKEQIEPQIDRMLADAGLKFWVTSEYKPKHDTWTADEMFAGLDRTYRLILREDYKFPEDLVQRIKLIPAVEDAHRLQIGEAELPRPHVALQLSPEMRSASDLIYLRFAKAFTKGRREVKIAILDTGADLGHRELQGKIGKCADFVDLKGLETSSFVGDITGYDERPQDEVGHGTHVAGIVAAKGLDMDEGVAPGCTIMPVRVLATMKNQGKLIGAGIPDNINSGIKWCVDNGAALINMSLGIKYTGGGLPHEDVIKYALSKNVTVVAASGNDGTAERYYPGALPGVIAVGAVDNSGSVTNFTSYGANITVVAPGLNIYSAFARNGYASASGTSQASPFVCGAMGLMKSYALERRSSLSNSDITYILKNTSDKVDTRLRSEHAGYGLLNLADAFKLLTHLLN